MTLYGGERDRRPGRVRGDARLWRVAWRLTAAAVLPVAMVAVPLATVVWRRHPVPALAMLCVVAVVSAGGGFLTGLGSRSPAPQAPPRPPPVALSEPSAFDPALESQKRFVANASHELRTPLAVIRTEIDVTMGDPGADLAEYRRMAVVVRDASIRANDLVESLLILARSEAQAGRRLVRRVAADLRTGVTVALSAVDREARRASLSVTTRLEPAPVVGDPGLLDRLAGNLIENAVRYNHLGGTVVISTGSDSREAWLVVRNTGFEVEPSDVPALFEPFRRGGRERTGNRGSGLGLSIVRAVCDAHGGTVIAQALPGGGLEVRVTLPGGASAPVHSGSAAVTDRPDPPEGPERVEGSERAPRPG